MSEAVTLRMQFADDGERQRYHNLREQQGPREASGMGVHVARRWVVPLIEANRNGPLIWDGEAKRFTPVDTMAAEIRDKGLGYARATVGRDLTDDEAFMYRMGFIAVVAQAKATTTRMHAAAEKLGEATALAAASIDASLAALAMMADDGLPAAPALPAAARPSSVVPRRRRLKPEDFGCLPQGPRPAGR